MYGFAKLSLLALSVATATASPLEVRQSGDHDWTYSPPWYPSPLGGTSRNWAEAYEKARQLVSQMTLLEKVNVTTGTGWQMGPCVGNTGPVPRLGFPSLCLQDGPQGPRFADFVTAFPSAITAGGTWDRELIRRRGEALGAEFRGKGVHVALGPSMGPIGKLPAGGRNWEGFGSDPYLQGQAAYEAILGLQSQGVTATAKHYIGNEQEHFRQSHDAISANIDDRTLHEIYMWPFQDSVRAGVGAVMCSYNQINNSAGCQNSWLQNNVLKEQLGFQGFIMSDWLAQMSGVASALAGMDMTMPGDGLNWDDRYSLFGQNLTVATLNSSIPIERLDDMVTRIVATYYKFGQDDPAYPEPNFSSWTKNTTGNIYFGSYEGPEGVVNQHVNVMSAEHSRLARKIAAEGTALLKNDRKTLPLRRPMRIGVYGEDAAVAAGGPNVCPDRGCNQGTLTTGWGSGTVDLEYLVDPLSAIKGRAATYGGVVSSVTNNTHLDEMAKSARKQDVCLVFINADAGEEFIHWTDPYSGDEVNGDRPNLNAQLNGDNVVLTVANNCENTVVVVHSVGPIVMEKWVNKRQVRSIVWAHLPGVESGNALVDVLWGDTNPSGKLPYTIGKSLEDYGPNAQILYETSGNPQQEMTTEIWDLDYRHFDLNNIKPRFEFGFGLSYTTFKYGPIKKTRLAPVTSTYSPRPAFEVQPPTYNSTLPTPEEVVYPEGFQRINRMIYPYLESADLVTVAEYPYPEGYDGQGQVPSQAGGAEGGHPELWNHLYRISFKLKNTGKIAGAEVAQLYIEPPQNTGVKFPKRQLRGFQKVHLQPGEEREVEFILTRRDLSYWDVVSQNWVIPKPGLGVVVGSSSRKFHGRGYIYVEA